MGPEIHSPQQPPLSPGQAVRPGVSKKGTKKLHVPIFRDPDSPHGGATAGNRPAAGSHARPAAVERFSAGVPRAAQLPVAGLTGHVRELLKTHAPVAAEILFESINRLRACAIEAEAIRDLAVWALAEKAVGQLSLRVIETAVGKQIKIDQRTIKDQSHITDWDKIPAPLQVEFESLMARIDAATKGLPAPLEAKVVVVNEDTQKEISQATDCLAGRMGADRELSGVSEGVQGPPAGGRVQPVEPSDAVSALRGRVGQICMESRQFEPGGGNQPADGNRDGRVMAELARDDE